MVLLEAAADRYGTLDELAPLKVASRWRTLLPLALVLLSLLSLALLPLFIERRLAALRNRLDTAESARHVATEIELGLAAEAAGTRGYLLTGDTRYAAAYRRARAARVRTQAALLALARQMGPEVHRDAMDLSTHLERADALQDTLYSGRRSRQEYVGRLNEQQARFEAAIAATDRLLEAIARAAEMHREQSRAVMRLDVVLASVLVLFALVAATFVARLGSSYRSLALRLDRRVRYEAALRVTARRLSDARSIQDVVQTAAECAVETTHAFGAYVERVEAISPQGEVEVVAASGAGTPPIGTRVAYPGSLTEAIIASGEPEIMTDVGAIGESMAPYLHKHCARCSGLVVPLSAEGQTLGAMVLLRDSREERFTPSEAKQARALGDLASAALRRVTLLEELSESEQRFRQIAENIREFVWLSNLDVTKHYYASSGFERIWGRTPQSLYEDPGAIIRNVHPDDRERVEHAIRSGALTSGRYDLDFRVVRPDGEIRWVHSRGHPVRNARGEVFRVAGITEDITERKQIEAERERLLRSEQTARAASEEAQAAAEQRRHELERVTESRTRLMRGFTHDVKNPLGAADGYLALLEDGVMGDLAAPQRESIERSRRAIRVALDLIDHLLELARAEMGQLELERVAMDVRATAREVVEEFRAQAEMKRLTLTFDVPTEPATIESDPARVRQILANLISNAVKFTPDGGHVTVRVETRSGAAAPGPGEWIVADVADTGPGISAEQQQMLFQEFARFAPSAVHGTGIGLAISQRIAHALGGVITVESKVGVGSTFTLWLPLRPETPPPPA